MAATSFRVVLPTYFKLVSVVSLSLYNEVAVKDGITRVVTFNVGEITSMADASDEKHV